ncbi:hypothetical protein AOXY_G5118 [Acipenser oxyrinchus oxyrinchus]|uniref:Uncharacterized protein n=1 Tax=Acipenser oxyrinchus oxyrinchus TaxID=40147 RepID=A0AAD8GDN3_ACIOX|nr:hypothetical protein AOXY_G5118 [Acipenser oxyrinchus oxyrinchus]
MAKHDPWRIIVMILALVAFIIMLGFNAVAGAGSSGGPFLQNTGNVSAKYETDITPSGWTFSIWGVIYSWQTLWFVYVFSGFCRRNTDGWMYCEPAILPYGFYITWIINNIFNIIWLFLWDREYMVAGVIILALIAFTNYIVLLFSYHGLNTYFAWLNKYYKVDLWLIRILVQNGVAVYTTWTTIATLLNFAVVLTYNGGVARETAGTVVLSILLVEVILWFVAENFFLDKYVRYTLTIYPVVIVALCGNMTKNFNAESPSRNGIFIAVLLGISCLIFAVRVLLVVWRHLKHDVHQVSDSIPMSPKEISEKKKGIFV